MDGQLARKQEPEPPEETATKAIITHQESFSGPLPHPSILQQYDQVVPGAAERIIVMAERQAEHRQRLEGIVIQADTKSSRLGLWFGFAIGLIGVGGGVIAAIVGSPVAGVVMSSISLGSLVGVFVYGSRTRAQERTAKERDAD